MIGAICGDIVGEPYEFVLGPKKKNFGPLFTEFKHYTDDTVMTIAVAEALLKKTFLKRNDKRTKADIVESMKKWGKIEPFAGYGEHFVWWLQYGEEPYGSFGNGSAMRVSSVGWMCESLEETRRMARLTAEVTHNHPEGIKGAEAVAAVIFLARSGKSKSAIKLYVEETFGYDLSKTCNEIRPDYRFDVTCQGTVPQAITAFLEGEAFEDVIRTAVSLGGDCDTLTCIAGAMAEAFYGVPEEIYKETLQKMSKEMLVVYKEFTQRVRVTVEKKSVDENGNVKTTIVSPTYIAALIEREIERK